MLNARAAVTSATLAEDSGLRIIEEQNMLPLARHAVAT
jgi:hypothetical protein